MKKIALLLILIILCVFVIFAFTACNATMLDGLEYNYAIEILGDIIILHNIEGWHIYTDGKGCSVQTTCCNTTIRSSVNMLHLYKEKPDEHIYKYIVCAK